ncbi:MULTISPECIES: NAD(P)H-quinone oxidoreductase subunit F [Cyanophyceae]|uniref:NAD(P)H-quinone oxidoreductase subunit F n=1 Tax=Cyanophyceae TaxID=3028117 RepID=UPI00000B1782|nr:MULTISPECIES: NAD(P)H-quinone oxidoreductase subunit F [Cyanophyceae]AAB62184.1 NADH dehydrogenase subunit 5 [Picosynechococcus sp. PCC 7002]ACA98186.1 NADH2 dehydrogenase (plastoquinone) chain 5 [Picosynechococcus sp. PCC 7002]AMA08015.1 NAD(P)H-quinone oxidoreductase subunit F [Picosynechococcus sp. PCC 73109]QCS48829.1 NAD(P)H-quinone oxidoreductase subunit F [Picosynechococcus sp. PCC 11901]SMH44355.1 NAD(P)H-quinone oxidoreductase subunit 5 [Picosynechococcus sp. OG1]
MNTFFSQSVWLVPCYPLLGMGLSALWMPSITRKTGPRPAGYVNMLLTFMALVHSCLAFIERWEQPALKPSLTWLQAADLTLSIDLDISSITIGALILIAGINLLAQLYAVAYLEMDWGWARFFATMSLFEAGMCALVLCNSLFFSYVVLEILTLGTYLLIGYWFNQSLVVTGARDAFLTKRVGDLFLLMGVVALLPLAGTWNFDGLAEWAATAELDPTLATLLCLALIAGPLGKCAQFPLHLWLDEAMESPVPATVVRNSLVVGTGAWVLIKLQPIFALSDFASTFMIAIGATTALGAAMVAIAQIDIKRSLSYSVSAYMGMVFMAVGSQQDQTTLVLLLTYGVAMAILVMAIGGVVLVNISQDLTQYGGLWSRRPITGICYLVGAASLVALPPFGGFWSLAQLTTNFWKTSPILAVILITVNALTSFSIMREFGLIFGGKPKQMTVRSPEGLWALVLPMVILAGFALHSPFILAKLNFLPDWHQLNLPLAAVLIISTMVGGGTAMYLYLNEKISKPIHIFSDPVREFFAKDLYTAELYKNTVIFAVALISKIIDWLDRYFVDGVINFLGLATLFGGQSLKYNNSGQSQSYALSIVAGILLFIAALSYPLLKHWQF